MLHQSRYSACGRAYVAASCHGEVQQLCGLRVVLRTRKTVKVGGVGGVRHFPSCCTTGVLIHMSRCRSLCSPRKLQCCRGFPNAPSCPEQRATSHPHHYTSSDSTTFMAPFGESDPPFCIWSGGSCCV